MEEALSAQHPVVALESTIITHGMPFPQNLETALEVEEIIKKQGAVPATVAILEGQIHAGLSHDQLRDLATKDNCVKTSRRDFPYVLAKGLSGGTTVSGTMVVAHKVGIPIFVTGGIGGVHRGAESTMDISADLTELGRTPVTVVSAGVKSILDVGRTLEYLETQGVCVSVMGSDARFPDFFTRDSGFLAPCHVESPALAAMMMLKRAELDLDSGMLIAVPIPEEHEAEGHLIKEAIEEAVKEAEAEDVCGRDVTPFILRRVSEITAGHSLQSNIALIKNNAKVGAEIAVEHAKLSNPAFRSVPASMESKPVTGSEDSSRPVVVGGCIVDFLTTVTEPKIEFTGRTHRGHVRQSYGGVGRNLADALTRLACRPFLVSAVGEDNHARALTAHNPRLGCEGLAVVPEASTAVYCVMLDHRGEALFGVGDMAVHNHVTPEHVRQFEDRITNAPLVLVDGNLSQHTINFVLDMCSAAHVPVWYEPTDVKKAAKPWEGGRGSAVTFTSPNLNELRALCAFLHLGEVGEAPARGEDVPQFVRSVLRAAAPLLDHAAALMVTLGSQGFVILRRSPAGGEDEPLLPVPSCPGRGAEPVGLYFPALPAPHVASVSGAGDCLAAGFVAGVLRGEPVGRCAAAGLRAAGLSLAALPAVPDTLTPEILAADPHAFSVIRL